MATTPVDKSRRIDHAIDRLNARWDLGLPRVHGVDIAKPTAEITIAEKCAIRIRFLCWTKTDNIDPVLADFDERARKIHADWVFKPSQERGTLPILPQIKSLVERDFLAKRENGIVRLSDKQRERLHALLFQVLEEPFTLAEMSESFSTERASDTTTSFITAATSATSGPVNETVSRRQERYTTGFRKGVKASKSVQVESIEPQLKNPTTRSTKRTLGSPEGRSKRRQTTLSQFLAGPTPPPPLVPRTSPAPVSFETVPSPAVSAVFSSQEVDLVNTSNNTSILSSQAEKSQDLLPTQDVDMYFADASFDEYCPPPGAFDPTDLTQNTPFKRQALLPSNLPFWCYWEIHRVAQELGQLPFQLEQDLRRKLGNDKFSYAEFWDGVKQVCSDKKIRKIPQKSHIPTWTIADHRYEDQESNKVLGFTATIDWEADLRKGLLNLRLNQPRLEESCRLRRKVGSDRLLTISIPVFSEYPNPDKLKRISKLNSIELHEKISKFLASETHYIAGRYWRLCYVEEIKTKPRPKSVSAPKRLKITMFAESGHGINGPPMQLRDLDLACERLYPKLTIEDLLEWHMPIEPNIGSQDLKLFSRIGLALSKTKPTVELYQHEFIHKRDLKPLMDDGCAFMSRPLAKAIWAAYDGEGEVPSAVQGRISGAKGLWIIDYNDKISDPGERGYWIQVSDSQLKIKPHPRDRSDADASQRTFEVLKFWGDCHEGHLNKQLVTILEDRGVPRSLLQETLEADLGSFTKDLSDSMEDPLALRVWMQEHGFDSRSRSSSLLGSFPNGNADQMRLLLESGFHPAECDKLWTIAYNLLSSHVSDYFEKMKIRLPDSTVVFCAPDLYGVLGEDEVFLSFSKPITDPRTGLKEAALDNIDVLLARNPAYLSSDMQRRKAVYRHELRHFQDVILFSIKGQKSTAEFLSGGDFDGDTVAVIWNLQYVERFRNVDMPTIPSQTQCKLVNKSRPLSSVFQQPGRPMKESMNDFLNGCLSFNARSNSLGMCSAEHERLVYTLSLRGEHEKLLHKGAVALAAVAGYLVDSNKQGWDFAEKGWTSLRREASGPKKLEEPAYKDDKPPRRVGDEFRNVIDFLKFKVVQNLKERTLGDFARKKSEVATYDRALSQHWLEVKVEMQNEQKAQPSRQGSHRLRTNSKPTVTLSDMLGESGLKKQISEVRELWSSGAIHNTVSSSNGDLREDKEFERLVQSVYENYKDIEPHRLDHELRRQFDWETKQHHPFPRWSLLKASCLYDAVRGNGSLPGWVWYVAGRELCRLKTLQHPGEVKVMTTQMFEILRVDTKFTKSLLERSDEVGAQDANIDEDSIGDEDEDDETVALD